MATTSEDGFRGSFFSLLDRSPLLGWCVHNDGVPTQSTQRRLTFHQCRELARAVERSENFAAVIKLLRPRGVASLRTRLPVTLQLLRADREGWLVTTPDGSCVLLRAPVPWRPAQPSRQLTALRILDEYWDPLVCLGSLLLLLLASVVCALLPATRSVALVLALLVLVLVSVMVTTVVLRGAWWLYTALEPRYWPRRGAAVEQYASVNWSVALCCLNDTALPGIDDILLDVLRRVSELGGARGERGAVPELVLIHDGACTTAKTATAVASATLITAPPPGGACNGLMFLHQPEVRAVPDRRLLPATGVTFILFGAAFVLVIVADFVAETERAACAASSCEGRPVDYRSALRWLLQRLMWSDPDGLSPATAQGWALGWITSFLTPVLAACLVVALRQYMIHLKQARKDFGEEVAGAMATTNTMVLVAADVERQAVIASLQAATGRNGPTLREARGRHTVFDLGVVSRTHVLLAQSEQGIESPAAMMLTASGVLRERRPDFVILVGICYGLKGEPEQHIGDIVVGSQLQNLNWKKVQTRAGAEMQWVRSGRVDPSPTLLDRFRAATEDWQGATVHRGLMLSESVLVDSAEHRTGLEQQFPDALAGEMEGAGVYAASYLEGIDWIVVKAISDWGDGTKNTVRQPEGLDPAAAQKLAARNAAGFLVHVLQGRGLDHLPSRVTGRG